MSRLVDAVLATALRADRGMITGVPGRPIRRSWPQVHEQARRIAGALVEDGLRPGATVAVLATDPAPVASSVQAVWLLGGTATMPHQPASRFDLTRWLADTVDVLRMVSADLVLVGAPFEPLTARLRAARIPCRPIAGLTAEPLAGVTPAAEDDTAMWQLSSGATAEPKAVAVTHGHLFANLTAMIRAAGVDVRRETFLSWLPLFHDMGMMGFLILPMAFGADLVGLAPAEFTSRPLVWAESIDTYRATITAGPDFSYGLLGRELAAVPDRSHDLSSLRIALNGGDAIDPRNVRMFIEQAGRFGMDANAVFPAYGLAEATLAVSFVEPGSGLRVDRVDAARLEHDQVAMPAHTRDERSTRCFPLLGRPLPGLEVRVVDDHGRPRGEREVGELWIRGRSVCRRYLTVDGPRPILRAGGWLATGDLGYLAGGEIALCGRVRDLIVIGGRRIHPVDIERAAAAVPGVRPGNVVAVRLDEGARRERYAVAFETRYAGETTAEERTCRAVARRVTDAVGVPPAAVVAVAPGTLPKTSSGKLRRAATRSVLADRLLRHSEDSA